MTRAAGALSGPLGKTARERNCAAGAGKPAALARSKDMHASSRPSAGLEIERSTPPMEARLVDHLPEGEGWQYEPKWDGFRCLAFRDKGDVALMSRSGKPLERYFPEVAAALRDLPESRFVVDGELVVPVEGVLSFAALQARLHPAASRIAKLARQTPAQFILFDCLQVRGCVHRDAPLAERRAALEQFAGALPESITYAYSFFANGLDAVISAFSLPSRSTVRL